MLDAAGTLIILVPSPSELESAVLLAESASVGADVLPAADQGVNFASEARTAQILEGDATRGGHLWPGLPGKTPFPEGWSATRVMHEISDVATDPAATRVVQGGRTIVTGTRDGIDIRVVIDNESGGIVTGCPINRPGNP